MNFLKYLCVYTHNVCKLLKHIHIYCMCIYIHTVNTCKYIEHTHLHAQVCGQSPPSLPASRCAWLRAHLPMTWGTASWPSCGTWPTRRGGQVEYTLNMRGKSRDTDTSCSQLQRLWWVGALPENALLPSSSSVFIIYNLCIIKTDIPHQLVTGAS